MLQILQQWHHEGDGFILSAVVMPDHVHVLFELGIKLTVGRCVSRWKSALLRTSAFHGAWQRDFWDHQVRASKSVEAFALYIFLNTYRSGLIQPGERWDGWWAPDPSRFEFTGKLDPKGGPPREWIEASLERLLGLQVGE